MRDVAHSPLAIARTKTDIQRFWRDAIVLRVKNPEAGGVRIVLTVWRGYFSRFVKARTRMANGAHKTPAAATHWPLDIPIFCYVVHSMCITNNTQEEVWPLTPTPSAARSSEIMQKAGPPAWHVYECSAQSPAVNLLWRQCRGSMDSYSSTSSSSESDKRSCRLSIDVCKRLIHEAFQAKRFRVLVLYESCENCRKNA